MSDQAFNISFTLDNQQYVGKVDPVEDLESEGIPAAFEVELNESRFGALLFKDCTWITNEIKPANLVKKLGEQIEKHYKL